MKSLARGYFWYPNLDKDIENLVTSCPACLSLADRKNKGDNQRKYFKGEKIAEFKEGEEVYARDYRNPNRKEWKKARMIEMMEDRTYLVEEGTGGLVWKTFRPTDRDGRLLQGRTKDEERRDRRWNGERCNGRNLQRRSCERNE
ncbi:Integrase zinc binding domain [Popillia japonica]|uniref:Integrase zinc binding domain n=1 Tax=Popillia japonica TaxID=7064 RepID=A0AAW1LBZ3_POPJA